MNKPSDKGAGSKKRYIELKRALFDRVYASLNERQREAIYAVNGPLLVLAGAGSGKTTVLVKRIVHIIKYGDAYASEKMPAGCDEAALLRYEYALDKMSAEEIESTVLPEFAESPCPPWAVLAITFTNKAAGEIKSRLSAALSQSGETGGDGDDSSLSDPASEIWAGTFHSVCMRILRRYGKLAGYRSGFTVYDTDDAKHLISDCMKELKIDDKALPVKTVMNTISRAKDKLLDCGAFAAAEGADYRGGQIAEIYRLYEKKLMDSNALDFDDIIMSTVKLLRENDEVREYYRSRFRYVCVDEYQDTNRAQFALTQLLTGEHRNIMVVGDDDQSIYKFRGATIENILGFDSAYAGARIIKLEQNYRSTGTILNAANSLIANNFGRRGKELWTAGDPGERIVLRELADQNKEGRFIAGVIEDLVMRGAKYRDFAVLYRMNAQSSPIEMAFAKAGMPYRMLGALRFYDRKEIKDVISYLCVIVNPDDSLRLKRIINEPSRKIGPAAINAAEMISVSEGKSLYEVMRSLSRYRDVIGNFVTLIETLREYSETATVSETIKKTLDLSGYRAKLEAGGEIERDRIANVDQLIANAFEYDKNEDATLTGFLEEVALVSDVDRYDETADAVVLMTIHSAKGLEFPVVFLPGMEDGVFPGLQAIGENGDEMEEERRLAYVAITRAKRRVIMTQAHQRMLYGQTRFNPRSRFIDEIPAQYIDDGGVTAAKKEKNAASSARVFRRSGVSDGAGVKVEKKKPPMRPLSVFAPGDIVSHRTFGRGEVISAREMGPDVMYEIAFDRVGTKKLMASFAKLERGN